MGRVEEVEWSHNLREYINRMKCRSAKYIVTSVIKYGCTVLVFEGVQRMPYLSGTSESAEDM